MEEYFYAQDVTLPYKVDLSTLKNKNTFLFALVNPNACDLKVHIFNPNFPDRKSPAVDLPFNKYTFLHEPGEAFYIQANDVNFHPHINLVWRVAVSS